MPLPITLKSTGLPRLSPNRLTCSLFDERANVETEREGLDITERTERAYNM